ncbi:MAG: hypothetical protein F6K00_30530 [Leptolyngbya sp. SIOISBB]|nr:hypothetical protein [Leptolyngbya sp. SIOISBB]
MMANRRDFTEKPVPLLQMVSSTLMNPDALKASYTSSPVAPLLPSTRHVAGFR